MSVSSIKKSIREYEKGGETKNGAVWFILSFIDEYFEEVEGIRVLDQDCKKAFISTISHFPKQLKMEYEELYNHCVVHLKEEGYELKKGAKIVHVKGRFFDNLKDSDNIGSSLAKALAVVSILESLDESFEKTQLKETEELHYFFVLLIKLVLEHSYIDKICEKLLNTKKSDLDLDQKRWYLDSTNHSRYIPLSEGVILTLHDLLKDVGREEYLFFDHLELTKKEICQKMLNWLSVTAKLKLKNHEGKKLRVREIQNFLGKGYKMYKAYFDFPLSVTAAGEKGYIGTDQASEAAFLAGVSVQSQAAINEEDDLDSRDKYQLESRLAYKALKESHSEIISRADGLIQQLLNAAHKKPKKSHNEKLALKFKKILIKESQAFEASGFGQAVRYFLEYIRDLAYFQRASSLSTLYNQFKKYYFLAVSKKDIKSFAEEDWISLAESYARTYKADLSYNLVEFIKYLKSKEIIEEVEVSEIYKAYKSSKQKDDPDKQPLFSQEEIKKIYLSLKNSGDELSLWFFCFGLAGLRAEECFLLETKSITARSLNDDKKIDCIELRVLSSKTRAGTNRVVPLHLLLPPAIFEEFALMIQRRVKALQQQKKILPLIPFDRVDFCFTSCSAGEKMNQLNKVVNNVRKAVKLREGLRFHTLRHYAISCLTLRLVEFIIQKPIQAERDLDWQSVPKETVGQFVGYQDDLNLLRYLAARNLFGIVSLQAGHANSCTTAGVYVNLMPLVLAALREYDYMNDLKSSIFR